MENRKEGRKEEMNEGKKEGRKKKGEKKEEKNKHKNKRGKGIAKKRNSSIAKKYGWICRILNHIPIYQRIPN